MLRITTFTQYAPRRDTSPHFFTANVEEARKITVLRVGACLESSFYALRVWPVFYFAEVR